MSIFAKAQSSWVGKLIKRLFRAEIINAEKEPDGLESFIVCMNHSSNWDPILIGACMHRPLRYMAKAELFKIPGLGGLIRLFGAYPVNRQTADVSSIKTTIRILEQGESVGMYIQGGRRRGVHPRDITPKNGAAMIALKAKSGVLPVSVIAKAHKMSMFCRTTVVFGDYIAYDELIDTEGEAGEGSKIKESMELYKKVTDKIYSAIVQNYDKYDKLNRS